MSISVSIRHRLGSLRFVLREERAKGELELRRDRKGKLRRAKERTKESDLQCHKGKTSEHTD